MIRILLFITLFTSLARKTHSFSSGLTWRIKQQHRLSSSILLNSRIGDDDDYQGEIDWDAEWKKVVASQDQPGERPGKDFYKTDVEKAAIKATREVQERVIEVRKTIAEKSVDTPSMPNMKSLQGDGRFWVAVLAIISIGLAVVSASSQQAYSNDSFYI